MSDRTDNFNRADDASSLGTPSDAGSGYTVYTGTTGTPSAFGISSNKGYLPTSDWYSYATLQTGGSPSDDVEISVTLSGFDGSAIRPGLCCRVSDGDNAIWVYERDSSNEIKLAKVVAASETSLGTFTHTPADGDVLTLIANGTSISVKINGSTVIGPVTETFNQSATRHGLFCFGTTGTRRWDTLSIVDLGGGVTAPTLSSAAVPTGGVTLTATLSQSGCIPTSGTGGFTLSASGGAVTVSSWAISSTTLTLTLSRTILSGETVTYSYARASTTDDISESTAAQFLADFSGTSVTNNSTQAAPTLSSWATNSGGTTITATLSESGCTPTSGTGGFTLGGTAATVASWAIASTTLTLTLSGTIYDDETVTASYDDALTTDDIVDSTSVKLADITNASVTNNSTVPRPSGSASGGVFSTGVFT